MITLRRGTGCPCPPDRVVHDSHVLIAVTGASGRTGHQVVRGLLAAGLSVRSVVRDPGRVRVAGTDVAVADLTTDDAATWLAGVDALIHTAGSADGTAGAAQALDHAATVALVGAAVRAGVRRVVQVSSMYADRPEQGPSFLRAVLEAKAASDTVLAESGLVWTIVRPAGLVDSGATGRIAVGRRLPGGTICRADVAAVCAACLVVPATERAAFDVTAGTARIGEALQGLHG